MSLHCPATLLVTAPPTDEEGLAHLVGALRGVGILAVVTGSEDGVGARLADALDVPLEVDAALSGAEGDPLAGVADLHRGETVAVLLPSAAQGVERLELGD
ncbi:hypothetical protein [Janibacter terrae]|uniref:hypothetical protein n=1 Tax=Janibacter terrae TaxID=103817 RepID=UPI00083142E7|nr:hypothetical protein [Janibacter terrae]